MLIGGLGGGGGAVACVTIRDIDTGVSDIARDYLFFLDFTYPTAAIATVPIASPATSPIDELVIGGGGVIVIVVDAELGKYCTSPAKDTATTLLPFPSPDTTKLALPLASVVMLVPLNGVPFKEALKLAPLMGADCEVRLTAMFA